MLSLKLASRNFRKGFITFAPFLLACVTMFVLLFVTASIAFSASLKKLQGGSTLSELMLFALVILAIFGLLILIYSYRFLQLQRSREYGLYDILGFGKRKIVAVAFFELLVSFLLTVVFGTLIGIGFSKFLFLIFVHLIGGNYFNLLINPLAIGLIAAIFAGMFILLFMIGSVMIWRLSSLDLLHEASKGEKEPKSNLILAILGVVLLGIGYWIAISVDNPVKALNHFFIAVLLVILGTYLFYISFTVWYLKWRKKRDSYYKPQHFITISAMLYRMKANAAGLASITILLSMCLVTIVVTLGIFVGTAQSVQDLYPREGQIVATNTGKSQLSQKDLKLKIQKMADQKNIAISHLSTITMTNDVYIGNKSSQPEQMKMAGGYSYANSNSYLVTMTTRASLQSLGQKNVAKLNKDEVAIYGNGSQLSSVKTISWYGTKFNVKQRFSQMRDFPRIATISKTLLIIFPNEAALHTALATYNKIANAGEGTSMQALVLTMAFFNIKRTDESNFTKLFQSKHFDQMQLNFRSEAFQDQKGQIGGIVFIGFVLGISFVLGAALIIYYKQLSEGAQDKRSFKILQEVGLSKKEVQKTITSQVKLIFFLPIVVAIIHFAFAYRMISEIDKIFGVTSEPLIALISVTTIVFVVLLYYLIYKATSRSYYKMVER